MKNKKNIYILLPIVLLVWGSVVYQFFSFTTTEVETPSESKVYTVKPLQQSINQQVVIDLNYRDPFLGTMYAPKNAVPDANKVVKSKGPSRPKETLVWPVIIYKGMIADTKEKQKKVFILVIDEKHYYMKIGETQEEVYLKTGDRESVYVRYRGNLNIILLQD
jgi:apolipoprotein N-acyltransferase